MTIKLIDRVGSEVDTGKSTQGADRHSVMAERHTQTLLQLI